MLTFPCSIACSAVVSHWRFSFLPYDGHDCSAIHIVHGGLRDGDEGDGGEDRAGRKRRVGRCGRRPDAVCPTGRW